MNAAFYCTSFAYDGSCSNWEQMHLAFSNTAFNEAVLTGFGLSAAFFSFGLAVGVIRKYIYEASR